MSSDVKRAVTLIGATLAFGASFLFGGTMHHSVAAPNTGYCERVNGNTDGTPCIEQDSRGRWHAEDSRDYRSER